MSDKSWLERNRLDLAEDFFHGLREFGILLMAFAPLDGALEKGKSISEVLTLATVVTFLKIGAGLYVTGSVGELLALRLYRIGPAWIDKWILKGGPRVPVLYAVLITLIIFAVVYAIPHVIAFWNQ